MYFKKDYATITNNNSKEADFREIKPFCCFCIKYKNGGMQEMRPSGLAEATSLLHSIVSAMCKN